MPEFLGRMGIMNHEACIPIFFISLAVGSVIRRLSWAEMWTTPWWIAVDKADDSRSGEVKG